MKKKLSLIAKPRFGRNPRNSQLYGYLDNKINIREFSIINFFLYKADLFHMHWPDRVFKWRGSIYLNLLFLRTLLYFFKIKKTKIIYTFHNPTPRLYKQNHIKLLPRYYQILNSYVDGLIVLNNSQLDLSYKLLPNPKREVIALGLQDIQMFQKSINTFKIENFGDYIFVAGIQERTKETEIIVKEIISSTNENINILVIGYFPDVSYFKKLNDLFSELRRVHIVNKDLSDGDFYNLSKNALAIAVSQNKSKNSGVATYALALNKPCITNSEELKNSINTLYDTNLVYLISEFETLIKTNPIKPVSKQFNMKSIAKETYEFYKKVISI